MEDKKIFFQSSLPRAGSTVLQNILGQNPEFYVTPTSGVLELLFAARGNYSSSSEFKAQDAELMKSGWLNFCKQGIQGFYKGITEKPYIMDKSRGWGIHRGFIDSFNPNPKIVVMVRDLRSVYASMEKNFRKSPEQDSGIVNWAELRGTTTEKRVNLWADGVPVGMAIERLKQMFDEGIYKHVHFVRYEDLISNPKEIMLSIYEYLEIDSFEHDFDNIEQITKEDDEVYGIFGDHNIRPKLEYFDPKFEETLGGEICNNIVNTYKWFYDYFKYE
jgi:sulfotransferase